MSYIILEKRISRLIKRMPKDVPFSPLNEAKTDALSATILLASAEIEDYIETLISRTIKDAFACYEYNGQTTITLLSCLHWMHPARKKLKTDNAEKDFNKNVNNIIKELKNRALNAINNNHGINSDNLNKLLLMVGIDPTQIETDISVLSAFATKRGAVAHRSCKNSAVTTIVTSASAIKTDISSVMLSVKTIEDHIQGVRGLLGSDRYIKKVYAKLEIIALAQVAKKTSEEAAELIHTPTPQL